MPVPRKCADQETKIVAMIGPGSGSEEMLTSLLQAGANVSRFIFSYGAHEEHAERLSVVRALEERVGRPIGVFADLQGSKPRIGKWKPWRFVSRRRRMPRAAAPISLSLPGCRCRRRGPKISCAWCDSKVTVIHPALVNLENVHRALRYRRGSPKCRAM